MTFEEAHQRYLAEVAAFKFTESGDAPDSWAKAYGRLFRPPVLRTRDDALAVLAFIEEEMRDGGALLGRERLFTRLRAYIEGRVA